MRNLGSCRFLVVQNCMTDLFKFSIQYKTNLSEDEIWFSYNYGLYRFSLNCLKAHGCRHNSPRKLFKMDAGNWSRDLLFNSQTPMEQSNFIYFLCEIVAKIKICYELSVSACLIIYLYNIYTIVSKRNVTDFLDTKILNVPIITYLSMRPQGW